MALAGYRHQLVLTKRTHIAPGSCPQWLGWSSRKQKEACSYCLLPKQNKMLFKGNQLELPSIHKYFGKWLVHFNYFPNIDNNIFASSGFSKEVVRWHQFLSWHCHSFLGKKAIVYCMITGEGLGSQAIVFSSQNQGTKILSHLHPNPALNLIRFKCTLA